MQPPVNILPQLPKIIWKSLLIYNTNAWDLNIIVVSLQHYTEIVLLYHRLPPGIIQRTP